MVFPENSGMSHINHVNLPQPGAVQGPDSVGEPWQLICTLLMGELSHDLLRVLVPEPPQLTEHDDQAFHGNQVGSKIMAKQ